MVTILTTTVQDLRQLSATHIVVLDAGVKAVLNVVLQGDETSKTFEAFARPFGGSLVDLSPVASYDVVSDSTTISLTWPVEGLSCAGRYSLVQTDDVEIIQAGEYFVDQTFARVQDD